MLILLGNDISENPGTFSSLALNDNYDKKNFNRDPVLH
jgi:hypothetical protein